MGGFLTAHDLAGERAPEMSQRGPSGLGPGGRKTSWLEGRRQYDLIWRAETEKGPGSWVGVCALRRRIWRCVSLSACSGCFEKGILGVVGVPTSNR